MSVHYLSPHHTSDQCLQDFESLVEETDPDVAISLESFLPDHRPRRYDYMECLKRRMKVPTVLVSCTDISSALQSCQLILESIKNDILQFHTRAMRRAAYEKYGLISPEGSASSHVPGSCG